MASKFLKGHVQCFGCGSSLLRRGYDKTTGRSYVYCFLCNAGRVELQAEEYRGSSHEVALGLMGREYGSNGEILTRLHTPGYHVSTIRHSPDEITDIREKVEKYVRDDIKN